MLEPFDLKKLALSQDFTQQLGVKKVLNTVPVRKTNRQEFIRVHSHPDWRLQTAVIELKDERETYLIAPELWPEYAGEIVPKVLFTAMNRQGVLFLWPVRLPGPDGRIDDWNRSAMEAAEYAMTRWVRVSANMALGAYDILEAQTEFPEPQWPEETFDQIVQVAFKQRYIASRDHPVLRALRGEL
jgi:hypothetical protein